HWRNPRLALLFITAFLAMGTFVSLYNYLGFRMINQFGLSEVLVGAVFLMYLAGTWSSARAGTLRQRLGNGPTVIFLAITMIVSMLAMAVDNLWVTMIALFAFTAAFFALHSSASGWIGLIATRDRAEASSMYLFCYYLGSSVVGWFSGFVFTHASWWVFVGYLTGILVVLLAVTVMLARLARVEHSVPASATAPATT